jgi:hypothetical protein
MKNKSYLQEMNHRVTLRYILEGHVSVSVCPVRAQILTIVISETVTTHSIAARNVDVHTAVNSYELSVKQEGFTICLLDSHITDYSN